MIVTKTTLKEKVRESLGDVPSSIFLARVDKTFDEADGSPESLEAACQKIKKMVALFIGKEEANQVGQILEDMMNF